MELQEKSCGGDCNGGVFLGFLDCFHFLLIPMLAYSMVSAEVGSEVVCLEGEVCLSDLECFVGFFLVGGGEVLWWGDLASSRVCLLEFEWGEGGRGAGVLVSVVVMGVVGECG